MMLQPSSIGDVQAAVRDCDVVHIRGAGTKSVPQGEGTALSVTRLSGVSEYVPEECVFTAFAGTPVRDVEAMLARHGQYLPFDPPFADEGATLGGTVASGVSGPRRYRYGGVRDFLIGVRIVDGEGREIRSGGKVVKNAAGFLLHHAVVGSRGRFGVLTELTFKVFPRPEARQAVTIPCGSVEGAFAVARQIEQLRCDCESIDFDQAGTLTVELAGGADTVRARAARLLEGVGVRPGIVNEGQGVRPGIVNEGAVHDSRSDPHPLPPTSCIKVPGAIASWQHLRPVVDAAHFLCAGAVAWFYTHRLQDFSRALEAARLSGLVIRGPHAGELIGYRIENAFEERVRRVLDPLGKFHAASHPQR